MKYSITHSFDPYLLARLSTDLQLNGVPIDYGWCNDEDNHPFDGYCTYLHTGDWEGFGFHSHGLCLETLTKDRYELTEKNYNKVLSAILK